jgi:hypothetical protein
MMVTEVVLGYESGTERGWRDCPGPHLAHLKGPMLDLR